jgi:hypothetical protein
MIRTLIVLATLFASPYVSGACITDQPELGDIGPSAELVCQALSRRFPEAKLAVENRSIHSPTAVTVETSVDGRPISLSYILAGYAWLLDSPEARTADVPLERSVLPGAGQ